MDIYIVCCIIKSVLDALKVPHSIICENLEIKEGKAFKDVWDSATVVKNAITNAVSVAATTLSERVVITK